jgi:hypothetical protein
VSYTYTYTHTTSTAETVAHLEADPDALVLVVVQIPHLMIGAKDLLPIRHKNLGHLFVTWHHTEMTVKTTIGCITRIVHTMVMGYHHAVHPNNSAQSQAQARALQADSDRYAQMANAQYRQHIATLHMLLGTAGWGLLDTITRH